MVEGRIYCAADAVTSVIAAFTDKSPDSEEKCNFTLANVPYTNIVNRELLDKRHAWVKGELVKLRSEICECKRTIEKTLGPHCSSGLFAQNIHRLNHLVEDLEV